MANEVVTVNENENMMMRPKYFFLILFKKSFPSTMLNNF